MNAKQRRKIYRERIRRDGVYYVIFRVDGEAIAVVRHANGMNVTFVDSHNNPLLFAWELGKSTWTRGRYSGELVGEPEATTLTEFGLPLYSSSRGVIKLDID